MNVGAATDADTEKQEPAAPAANPWSAGEAPDGGLTAWLVVLGAWCTAFCSFGWINSMLLFRLKYRGGNLQSQWALIVLCTGIGTFQEFYQGTYLRQYTPEEIAWIPSLQVFMMFATVHILLAINIVKKYS